MFAKSEEARKALQGQLRDYVGRSEEDSHKNKEFQDLLLKEKAEQNKHIEAQRLEIHELKRILSERDQQIRSLESTNLQHENEILRLSQELKIRIDVGMQLRECQTELTIMIEQKDKLKKDLDTASDYLLEQDEKVYKANQTSLELLKNLKETELEIETLKDYIVELKQRVAVYIPVKEDNVDQRLAEYINNYPERSRLKIMFMRESEGIYQFGTKKIYVRVCLLYTSLSPRDRG